MNLRDIQIGDRVEAKYAGVKFEAIVESIDDREICRHPVHVRPIIRGNPHYLRAHEVLRVIKPTSTELAA